MRTNRAGFTLIELLVVVAIIGMLSSIILSSVGTARIKGRDAARIQDLKQIGVALQMYANDHNGTYPACPVWSYSTDSTWNCLVTALAPYMQVPVDPVNNLPGPWSTGRYSFAYGVKTGGFDYDLVGQVEETSNPIRCAVRDWQFHYHENGAGSYGWCTTYSYSPYLFEDH